MPSTITDLNNFDLVEISGEDAVSFLQGQLTCNMERLNPTHSLRGAYCDLKGRVISDMRVLQGTNGILLVASKGMGYALRKTLDKYIVFSKAKTSLATRQFERYGISGQDAAATLRKLVGDVPESMDEVRVFEGGYVYRLPDAHPRFEMLVSVENDETLDTLQDLGVTDDLDEWELAEVRQGIVHIHPEIQETFTPQLLNYDINGIIDFKKGCYTGQEIVARMHYRASAKKRLYLASATSEMRITLETLILHKGESVGEIVSIARTESGDSEFLAILPCELVEQSQKLELVNGNLETAQRQEKKAVLKVHPLPGL